MNISWCEIQPRKLAHYWTIQLSYTCQRNLNHTLKICRSLSAPHRAAPARQVNEDSLDFPDEPITTPEPQLTVPATAAATAGSKRPRKQSSRSSGPSKRLAQSTTSSTSVRAIAAAQLGLRVQDAVQSWKGGKTPDELVDQVCEQRADTHCNTL